MTMTSTNIKLPHYSTPWPSGRPKPRAPLPSRYLDAYNDAPANPRTTCPICSTKLQDFESPTLKILPKKHSIRVFCTRCNFGKAYAIPMELAFTLAFGRKKAK